MEQAMGIRESLNRRPRVAMALGAGLVAVAIPLMIWAGGDGVPGRADEAYYSDDDGKSFFVDDIDKVYPFDRNGKSAYRAYVYDCGDGKPFVAYLARYTDSARTKLTELEKNANDPEAAGQIAQLRSNAIEVKKPGDEKWVGLFTPQGGAISSHPPCPGGGTATSISP
jgi:hypothetical protein